MTQNDLLKLVAKWLDEIGVKYMLTGAWSVIYYGRVRTSHDLDFVVEIKESETDKLVKTFERAGEDFWFQPDAIKEAVEKKQMFMVRYMPSGDKIDFWLVKQTEFDRQRLKRRVQVVAWGQKIYLSSAEDTIVQKLKWYGMSKIEKHLVDAAFVWQLQNKLDRTYIKQWAEKLKVSKYLPKLAKINLEDYY